MWLEKRQTDACDRHTLGHAVVKSVILLTATRDNAAHVLRDAATVYKVGTGVIAAKVKQEFATKDKAKAATPPSSRQPARTVPKSAKRTVA